MTNQIAEGIVRLNIAGFEKQFPEDTGFYAKCVSEMAGIDLQRTTAEDVDRVIRPFLYTWGRMGRVLGQERYAGWQQKVAAQLSLNSSALEHLRTVQLQEVLVDEYRHQIIDLYSSFEPVVRYIASGKLLHLICPTFFPLWDNPIANGLRAQYYTGTYSAFSSNDYFEFTKAVHSLLRRYQELWSELSIYYGKSVLRMVDEYLWWAVWRPYSLVM